MLVFFFFFNALWCHSRPTCNLSYFAILIWHSHSSSLLCKDNVLSSVVQLLQFIHIFSLSSCPHSCELARRPTLWQQALSESHSCPFNLPEGKLTRVTQLMNILQRPHPGSVLHSCFLCLRCPHESLYPFVTLLSLLYWSAVHCVSSLFFCFGTQEQLNAMVAELQDRKSERNWGIAHVCVC